jgi:hypothetical protein
LPEAGKGGAKERNEVVKASGKSQQPDVLGRGEDLTGSDTPRNRRQVPSLPQKRQQDGEIKIDDQLLC